jgi:threonyl-tRNA synthetase
VPNLDYFLHSQKRLALALQYFIQRAELCRRAMEGYSRKRHEEEDYQFVYSPHLTKAALFETSGHLQWNADGMYPPMVMDEEFHADGTIKKAGQKYYMKPMNMPISQFNLQIFTKILSRLTTSIV